MPNCESNALQNGELQLPFEDWGKVQIFLKAMNRRTLASLGLSCHHDCTPYDYHSLRCLGVRHSCRCSFSPSTSVPLWPSSGHKSYSPSHSSNLSSRFQVPVTPLAFCSFPHTWSYGSRVLQCSDPAKFFHLLHWIFLCLFFLGDGFGCLPHLILIVAEDYPYAQ